MSDSTIQKNYQPTALNNGDVSDNQPVEQAKLDPTKNADHTTPLVVPFAASTHTDAATQTDAPPLPDVAGVKEPTSQAVQPTVEWLNTKPRSLSQAVSLLSDLAGDQMLLYGRMKNLFSATLFTMQVESAKLTKDQVEGERKSAMIKLVGSLLAAGASAGAGFYSSKMDFTKSETTAGKAGMVGAVATITNQLTNQIVDAYDKLSPAGGTHAADEAKMQKAVVDIFVQMDKSQEDSFNSGYDQRQKNLQSVFDLMRQVADSNNSTLLNINANV